MRAGFAEAVITPKDGVCVTGYGLNRATGIHDDLYASAVYFQDDDRQAVLISFDLLGYFDEELLAKLRASVQKAVPLDEKSIFFTCTHTHEGPWIRPLKRLPRAEQTPPDFGYLEGYREFLAEQAGKVAEEAASVAQEFTLGVNRSFVDENMNRRFFLNDETYLSVPDHKELTSITYGHTDKELGMLYFFPKGGRHPFGIIVNYTVHPLTAGDMADLLSADVPGVVRGLIKESLKCLSCYITGATGDNHPKAPEGGFAETRRVGEVLATEVIKRRYDSFRIEEPVRLKCMTRSVRLRYATLEELETIPGWREETGGVPRIKLLGREPGEEVEVSYSLLAIGPVLFIGVPGEALSELGSMLKWCSPFKRTYIMYEATGGFGYISHPNAYRWGGYEAVTGFLSPASVRPLINHILDAAEELYTSP